MFKNRSFVYLVVILLAAGGSSFAVQPGDVGSAGSGIAPFVYMANTDGEQILEIDLTLGADPKISVVYSEIGSTYEDLVVGPEGYLYACDPANGVITRIDPADFTAVTIHDGTTAPWEPQCGWFTADGNLLVTDRVAGSGVWEFPGGDGLPTNFLDLGPDFRGEGLTQAANGDLLIVDKGQGMVWRLPLDPQSGIFEFGNLGTLISGLSEPVGIARANFGGDIFVAEAGGVYRYDASGGPGTLCGEFGRKDRPFFLEAAPDDFLYVATTSNNDGKLWEVHAATCAAIMIQQFDKKHWVASFTGVALPYNTDYAKPPRDFNGGPEVFGFGDHAYQLELLEGTLDDPPCSVNVTAIETPPSCMTAVLANIPDLNDPLDPVDAHVVIYAGENGRGWVYDVAGSCPASLDALYEHAISNFPPEYMSNPRIVVCESDITCASPPTDCEVVELNSYFPFDGIIEGDGFTGGVRPSFSQYFLIDVALNQGTGDGEMCAFEPPMFDVEDIDDPNLPAFSTTETVPLKFRVADALLGSCEAGGPYLENAQILMSMARVRDNFGAQVFEPVQVQSAGGSQPENPAIFGNPANPNQYYHYNAKFTGYEPGIYQMVLVALTDNFEYEVRYFRVVN